MRKVLLLFLSIAFVSSSFAISTISEVKPTLNANAIFIPVGKTGQKISLMELSKISLGDLEKLTNRKMKLFDRMAFKSAQKKLNKRLNEDGTFKKAKYEKAFKRMMAGETGFHLGGFALGFFVGLIGVLIAYIINDDYKRNRTKWAWIGLGAAVVLSLILVLLVIDSVDDYY